MNITYDKIDELNATVVIDLEKSDYSEKVEKELKRVQKNVALKGFRPGKAPLDMVRKFYGKSILADEIQKVASDKLQDFIQEEKLDILGYPLSSSRIESQLDIEHSDTFKFAFDLGLAPQFDVNIGKDDHLTLFKISVSDQEVTKDIDYARKQYGKLEDVNEIAPEDVVYVTLTELDEQGLALEGGISEKPASIVPSLIQNEDLKNQFLGQGMGFNAQINIFELFNNNDTVITNSLGIQKEGIRDLNPTFLLLVTGIKRREAAELNEEFYKQVFGENDIPENEEAYREKIKSNLIKYYENEAQLWVDHQIGHLIEEKHGISLPDEFLKRWLLTTKQEHYSAENIDSKYASEKSALLRRLVIDKIATQFEIRPDDSEIIEEATVYYKGLYRQYGLPVTDEMLAPTLSSKLKESAFVEQMADRVLYRKTYDKIKDMITLDEKEVSVEEYFSHVNSHKHD